MRFALVEAGMAGRGACDGATGNQGDEGNDVAWSGCAEMLPLSASDAGRQELHLVAGSPLLFFGRRYWASNRI